MYKLRHKIVKNLEFCLCYITMFLFILIYDSYFSFVYILLFTHAKPNKIL